MLSIGIDSIPTVLQFHTGDSSNRFSLHIARIPDISVGLGPKEAHTVSLPRPIVLHLDEAWRNNSSGQDTCSIHISYTATLAH